MVYQLEENNIWFPKPELADEDGLLAVGGDLSVERLILAYRHGIFPWFSEESPILWYSPHERFVLFPKGLHISTTMRRVMRSGAFQLTHNQNFDGVIRACSEIEREGQDGTWITPGMIEAYIKLHQLGYAHSVEVWKDEELVGGIYGVLINGIFCGESMFSRVSNASKMALISVARNKAIRMIDCQVHTSHLESMGAEFISRENYLELLNRSGPTFCRTAISG